MENALAARPACTYTVKTMARFLLIGLDGFEPSLAARWMDSGDLPNLALLRARGAFGCLASTKPPVTFPAWTTCVTGVGPGQHGIFDFTEVREGAQAIRFVNSSARQAPALWNILSAAGKRVCVLGVPGAYPPEGVNGILVAGFDSPVTTGIDASFVYPRARYADVAGWGFADFQEGDIGPGWHAAAHVALLKGIARKEAITSKLFADEAWDFAMVVFGEADTASHHFWLFHDPASPRHRPGMEHAIRDIYVRLDHAVGRLCDAFGGDAVIGVVSDHGFGGAGDGVVHLNNWLAERGHLRFARARGGWLKALALRLVPVAWRGALFRRFNALANRAESHARFSGIDWQNTRAWSEELSYFPTIRINLAGRDPHGVVSATEYDAYVAALCAELKQWEVVAEAWPRASIYSGPMLGHAPDIVLELALEAGYSHTCLRARGGAAFRRLKPHEYLGGKERGMNGAHRDPGTLVLSSPADIAGASLLDIAPTVLAVMGIPAPPMEGRALLGASGAATAPLEYTAVPAPYSEEQEAQIEERLRALGYFE